MSLSLRGVKALGDRGPGVSRLLRKQRATRSPNTLSGSAGKPPPPAPLAAHFWLNSNRSGAVRPK